MNILYGTPLTRGWERMKKALFHPFDIGKWFTLGFTAFLAGLSDCQGSSGGGNYSNAGNNYDWNEFFTFPQTALEWLVSHPFWSALILTGIAFLLTLIIVLTWLSSRGKFMFLYNVVNDEAEVRKPWYEYKKEGNSLFVWRLVFGLLAFAVLAVFLVFCFNTAKNIYYEEITGIPKVWAIIKMVLLFLVYLIVVGYITLFLNDFVAPLMYRYRLTASRGWYRFFNILWRYFGYFFLYGLFVFVLGIFVAVCVIFFSVITCCIGLLLLAIPYIGSVVLLPVSYWLRAFSLEFLEQFGDEYSLFPKPELPFDE